MTTEKKTFLITGAGSGLGRDLSSHFARGGHKVMVTDRDRASSLDGVAAL